MSENLLIQQLEGVSDLDLMYIPDDELAGILGEIGKILKIHPSKAHKYLEKISRATRHKRGILLERRPPLTKDLSRKAKFERFAYKLPADVREKLIRGDLTIGDYVVYSIKNGGEKNVIEMIEPSDTEKVGRTNLNSAKLKNDSAFLITEIQLLSVKANANYNGDGSDLDYDVIGKELRNGVFSLKVGQHIALDDVSCEVFVNDSQTNLKGFWQLDMPIMVRPNQEISFTINLPQKLPAKTFLKLMLHGARTIKN